MRPYQKDTIKFYNDYAEEYSQKTRDLARVSFLNLFISHLPQKARVLDIGCAFGRDTKIFLARGFDTYGIDLSKNMIQKAREFSPGARFEVMDVLKMKFPDSHFDGIWCSTTLLHLKKSDIPVALKEILRILKQEGPLALLMRSGSGEKIISDSRYHNARKLYSYFSLGELESIVAKAGFEITDSREAPPTSGYDSTPLLELIAKKK